MNHLAPRQGKFAIILLVSFCLHLLMLVFSTEKSQYEYRTNKGEKIPVSFQLVDKGSQWKIRNINVSGIDLGLQFRTQFAATVKRNGGSLDKAIANFKPDADAAVNNK